MLSEGTRCPKCGFPGNQQNASFCASCGAKLLEVNKSEGVTIRLEGLKYIVVLVAVIFVGIIALKLSDNFKITLVAQNPNMQNVPLSGNAPDSNASQGGTPNPVAPGGSQNPPQGPSTTPSGCGDKICGVGETVLNCPLDCSEVTPNTNTPQPFIGQKSTGFTAVQMNDFKFKTDGTVTLKIGNRKGRTIQITGIAGTYSSTTKPSLTVPVCSTSTGGSILGPNDVCDAQLGTWSPNPVLESAYNMDLIITYTDISTGVPHSDFGTISGSVVP